MTMSRIRRACISLALTVALFSSSYVCLAQQQEEKQQDESLIINVINVATDQGRWEHVKSEFEQLDLSSLQSSLVSSSSFDTEKEQINVVFKKFEAVNGKELTKHERRENASLGARLFCTEGTIGCYMSHRKLWEQIYYGNNRFQIVLEDDVVFAERTFVRDVTARIDELEQAVGKDSWDVLLLGGLGCINPNRRYGLFNIPAHVSGGCRTPSSISEHIHIPKRPFGTHAYVLSKRGAKKLLQLAWKATYHVDCVVWGIKELDLYIADPLLTYQDSSPSTVGAITSGIETWIIPQSIRMDDYTKMRLTWVWNEAVLRIPFTNILITQGRYLLMGIFGTVLGTIQLFFGHGKYSSWILPTHITLYWTFLVAFNRLINTPRGGPTAIV